MSDLIDYNEEINKMIDKPSKLVFGYCHCHEAKLFNNSIIIPNLVIYILIKYYFLNDHFKHDNKGLKHVVEYKNRFRTLLISNNNQEIHFQGIRTIDANALLMDDQIKFVWILSLNNCNTVTASSSSSSDGGMITVGLKQIMPRMHSLLLNRNPTIGRLNKKYNVQNSDKCKWKIELIFYSLSEGKANQAKRQKGVFRITQFNESSSIPIDIFGQTVIDRKKMRRNTATTKKCDNYSLNVYISSKVTDCELTLCEFNEMFIFDKK